jgi:hypothetical protein
MCAQNRRRLDKYATLSNGTYKRLRSTKRAHGAAGIEFAISPKADPINIHANGGDFQCAQRTGLAKLTPVVASQTIIEIETQLWHSTPTQTHL